MATTRPIQIAPSILSADFGHLADQIAAVEPVVDWLHLDIMDGHFVPNLSIGVPVVKSVSRATSSLLLDTHLMITDPLKYAEPFVKAGSDSITFHIEVSDQPGQIIEHIRSLGAKVGISLNPGTPADAVFGVLDQVDLVLVMTVWPGFGGQEFIEDCLDKVAALAARMRPTQVLQVDGGIDTGTAPRVVQAGANNLVAGSAVFGEPDPRAAVEALQRAALAAAKSQPDAGSRV